MKNNINEILVENNEKKSGDIICKFLKEKKIIYIKSNEYKIESLPKVNFEGPAIILNSSGSQNLPKKCLHPIINLERSAKSSGDWLIEQGFEIHNCFIFNTLPLNHISGLMPLWRSKVWDCEYINITPNLLKSTKDLLSQTITIKKSTKKYFITSLVPTQLNRLLLDTSGTDWLKIFDLIWVGGAAISQSILRLCIKNKINLSPCYGATETAAMISSLKPREFLNYNFNEGEILKDIDIRINRKNLIEVKTKRLGIQLNELSLMKSFDNKFGWWESGDLGKIIIKNNKKYLKVYGRIDNAINSGGETIFLDVIHNKIENFIFNNNLPIDNFRLNTILDNIWGNRFETIIFFKKNTSENEIQKSIKELKNFCNKFPKYERPFNWVIGDKNSIRDYKNNNKNWKNSL